MPKPRLSKQQKIWIQQFKSKYSNVELKNVYEGLSGDRIVVIEWWERRPKVITEETVVETQILHHLRVKLKKSGSPRETADYSFKILSIKNEEIVEIPEGQISLSLPQIFAVHEPQNPVVIKTRCNLKPKRRQPRRSTQYNLPLSGVATKLHEINLSDTGEVLSQEELMNETVLHNDSTGKEIRLPITLVKILSDKKASPREWESAISLYQVGKSSCLIQYLEGLDYLRSIGKSI